MYRRVNTFSLCSSYLVFDFSLPPFPYLVSLLLRDLPCSFLLLWRDSNRKAYRDWESWYHCKVYEKWMGVLFTCSFWLVIPSPPPSLGFPRVCTCLLGLTQYLPIILVWPLLLLREFIKSLIIELTYDRSDFCSTWHRCTILLDQSFVLRVFSIPNH